MPALFLIPVLGVAFAMLFATRVPSKPASSANASPMQFELDHGMPESLVHQVLAALVHGRDPAQLEALARECESKFPLSSGQLRKRAAELRATATTSPPSQAQAPAAAPNNAKPHDPMPTTTPTMPPPSTAPATPSIAPPAPQGDGARVVAAAMRALVDEQDPVVLEGFADSIRAQYPEAAAMLAQRAAALRSARATMPPAPPPGPPSTATPASSATPAFAPPPAPPATAPAAAAPAPTAPPRPAPSPVVPTSLPLQPLETYVVKPGDSEFGITQSRVHDARRWRELVDANPTKPRKPDGHFIMLRIGETINIPASWAAATAASKGAHP